MPVPDFPVRGRGGYNPDEVDSFFVRLSEQDLTTPGGRSEALALVVDVTFRLARRHGYLPAAVDEFLDEVRDRLTS